MPRARRPPRPSASSPAERESPGDRNFRLISLALVILIAIAYASVRHAGFVSFDDPDYMSENPRVAAGLTAAGIGWAFTTGFAANWHPLTWMSHMLDVQLFGLRPGPAHTVNVVIHVLNTLVLFGLLRRMTGALWRSAVVAALFALHPLHVESVAWISERKDLLSTLFGLITIWLYVSWTKQRHVRLYLLMIATFALGLMSKPMLVTLPFVLMLIDVWPLARAQFTAFPAALFREKIPLLIVAAASSAITFAVQAQAGAVQPLETVSFLRRCANAVWAYAIYLAKTIWPVHLSVFYPYRPITIAQIAIAALVLLGISALSFAQIRKRPYLLVGWLWFVGMLVPVIGLIQVGSQAMADRYTYLSLVGIFMAVVWGLSEKAPRVVTGAMAVAAIALGTWLTFVQAGTWTNSVSLWQHAVDVSKPNPYAESALASALAEAGQRDRAAALFADVLRIKPDVADVHNDYAQLLVEEGQLDAALGHFREAIRLNPKFAEAHHNVGVALLARGDVDAAIENLSEALRLNPDLPRTQNALGDALARKGQLDEAITHLQQSIRLKPTFADPHNNLGKVFATEGRLDEAVREFSEAIRLDPQGAEAYYNLGVALMSQRRPQEAIGRFRDAIRLAPTLASAHNNLGNALSAQGDVDAALGEFAEAVRVDPKQPDYRFNLAVAYVRRGRIREAAAELQEALRLNPAHEPARRLLDDLSRRGKE